jgi:hypothetical protein
VPALPAVGRFGVTAEFRRAKKKMAGTEVPAKFEQGGFTSGRRKGPQTLFPGTSPGNLPRSIDRATRNMDFGTQLHQQEFLLARLQKPQLSEETLLRCLS